MLLSAQKNQGFHHAVKRCQMLRSLAVDVVESIFQIDNHRAGSLRRPCAFSDAMRAVQHAFSRGLDFSTYDFHVSLTFFKLENFHTHTCFNMFLLDELGSPNPFVGVVSKPSAGHQRVFDLFPIAPTD